MEHESFVDDLTGLYNRRYLRRWIKTELARCKRYNLPLSLALLDLDNFKQINDIKGHLAGDNVLIQFSQFLKEKVRAADMVVRYGGDEFIIIFPNTKIEQAKAVMQRILNKAKRKNFNSHSLSASCGISSYPDDGAMWESLFQTADRRMYQIKRTNKGRIGTEEVLEEKFKIPTPRMVGRRKELRLCREHIEKKEKILIVISGEAGVGKTRLVNELISSIPDRILFTGASYPAMLQSPYFAARALLKGIVFKREEVVRDIFVERLLLPQKRIISSFLPNFTQTISETTGDRLMLFDTITKLMDLISERIPLAVLFDDLHWASESTMDLLHFLLKSKKSWYPIFGTYRTEEIRQTPFSEKVGLMGREKLYREIPLETLDRNTTEEMIAMIMNYRVSPSLLEFIYRESGGNPFFIEEILKEMKESGAIYIDEKGYKLDKGVNFLIPKTIEDTINHKLTLIGKNLREVINIAALIGKDFKFSLLHSITELNEGELYDLLDQLKGLQFLIEKEGHIYSFKEDVFRQVIVDKILTGTRRRLHEKIACTIERMLRDSVEKFEQLAYHYHHSGNKKKVVEFAEKAGNHAIFVYAHKEAIRFYNWALEGEMKNDQRGKIWRKIGSEFAIKGEYERSIQSFKEALNIIKDSKEKASIYKELGRTYEQMGNYKMALSNLRKARKTYVNRQEKYSCDPDMAWIYMEMGKEKSAVRSALRAKEKIDKGRFPKEYSVALNTLATISLRRGKNNRAIKLYDEARRIREEIGYKEGVGSIYVNMAGVYLNTHHPDKAEECFKKGLELYRNTGFKEGEITTLYNLGILEMRRNDLNRAENYLLKALEMEEWVGGIKNKVLLLKQLGYILLIKGSQKNALDRYRLAEEEAKKTESPETLVRMYASLVTVYLEYFQNTEKAKQYLKKAEKWVPKIDEGFTLSRFYLAKVRYNLAVGEIEEGINTIKKQLLPVTKEIADITSLHTIYLLWAQFYSAKGWERWGMRYIEIALEYAKKTEDIYEIAEVHRIAGKFYLNLGKLKEAKREFNKALRGFKELRFNWYIQNTEKELAKIKEIS